MVKTSKTHRNKFGDFHDSFKASNAKLESQGDFTVCRVKVKNNKVKFKVEFLWKDNSNLQELKDKVKYCALSMVLRCMYKKSYDYWNDAITKKTG